MNATYSAALEERLRHALILREQGAVTAADATFRELVTAAPEYAAGLTEFGRFLTDTGRVAEAVPFLEKAAHLAPELDIAHNNLGAAYLELGRTAEAAACFEDAIRIVPGIALLHDNLGNARYRLQEFDAAEVAFRRALELSPDLISAHFGLGLTLLITGRYAEGWKHYSRRFELRGLVDATPPPANLPRWRGEPLKGKSILVWPEQGFGDELMCVRYAAKLRELGATTVTWACSPELLEVIRRVKGVSEPHPKNTPVRTRHDFLAPALELPALLGTTLETIPGPPPYLREDPKLVREWKTFLNADGMRVGLVWKGSPTHKNDKARSLPSLDTLAPLWEVPGVSFFSLQKGVGHTPGSKLPITNLGGVIRDFSDTAAIIAKLDLVICVDTSVAHLAGALGKPVWVMIPFERIDWRWTVGRDDSPWYPEVMRLFRQGRGEPWESVVVRLAAALPGFRDKSR